MRRLCGAAAGKRFLRDAFFCLAKRKRPSDSPPGCARRQCETSRWAVIRTCRPVTSPSRRPASKSSVGNALSAGTARPSSPAAMCRHRTGDVMARKLAPLQGELSAKLTEGSAAKISCFAAFDFPRCPGRSPVSAAPRRRRRCGGAAFRGGRWRGGYCAPPRWCGARRRA